MNSDVLLIVLTEDRWLYAGLAALMPEIVCRQAGFCTHRLPREVRSARRIIIAVDSRIVFRGEWSSLTALKALRPDATVVWLTQTEHRLLPLFLSGASVPLLSKLTGKRLKTLYSHRHKILLKTGFRHPAFLQFVYERNRGLPGIPGLERTYDVMPQKKGEEGAGECTV
ncbi:TPA: transcriptional regulator [Citrobacter freundii]|nr:transcriptional regulator [Citrobacter freundii]